MFLSLSAIDLLRGCGRTTGLGLVLLACACQLLGESSAPPDVRLVGGAGAVGADASLGADGGDNGPNGVGDTDSRYIDLADGSAGVVACTDEVSPPAPLRRLTLREYENTIHDLLGATPDMEGFPADPVSGGFDNNATAHSISPLLAEKYLEAAEATAALALENLNALLPCDPATGEQTCVRQFIRHFGRRAYRRPLSSDESQRLEHAFAVGRDDSFESGIALVIQAVLQAPAFLYRLELDGGAAPQNGLVPLDQYQLATRLSYLLWGSTPSEELLDAAALGELGSTDQLADWVRAMLDDPRAPRQLGEFYRQWMGLNDVQRLTKDPDLHPDLDAELRSAMAEELPAFVEHMMWHEDRRLGTLLTAPIGFVSGPLALLYGVEATPGDTPTLVDFDPNQRAGILTQAAVLAVHSLPNQSSPVARGKLVREKLLCQEPPAPPANVNISPPELDPNKSTRERFAAHTENDACSGCHELMDPIGFAFERYDAIGRYRDSEGGVAIDTSGWITGSLDSDGSFENVRELAERLAGSRQVHDCVTKQWFRFAFGRFEASGDACSIAQVQAQFSESDGDLIELLVAIVQSDSFRYRRAADTEQERP